MPNIPQMDALWADWGTTEAQIIAGQADDPGAAWTEMADKIQSTLDG